MPMYGMMARISFGERSNDKLLPIWSASFNYNVMEHFKGEQDWFDDCG